MATVTMVATILIMMPLKVSAVCLGSLVKWEALDKRSLSGSSVLVKMLMTLKVSMSQIPEGNIKKGPYQYDGKILRMK